MARVSLALVAGVLAGCLDASPVALSISVPGTGEVVVGDELTLDVVSSVPPAGIQWETSDESVAVVVAGVVEALRPGTVTITARAVDAAPTSVTITVVARAGGYSAAEVDYFTAIAFGSEFGGATAFLRRWPPAAGPSIRINGSPTASDLTVLDSVVAEINRIAPVGVEIVTDAPTVELHFVPVSEFTTILPQAPPGNIGLVWLWWTADDVLIESVVLIATEPSDALRAHIIREEITQMLGLLQDSFLYPESIFYQAFSDVTEYLPIDRAVIEILYRPELMPGMTAVEAARVARRLLRSPPMVAASPRDERGSGAAVISAAEAFAGATPSMRPHVPSDAAVGSGGGGSRR